MASAEQAPTLAEKKSLPRKRHAYRFGVLTSLVAVAIAFVLTPLAVTSVLAVLHGSVSGHTYELMRPTDLHGEWTKLNVSAFKIDETAHTVTFRVSGFHNCGAARCIPERVSFFSLHADPSGALGAPPSTSFALPRNSNEIEQEITLPMEGNLTDYPFDHYTLLLGVAFSKIGAGGRLVPFSPGAADSALAYSIEDAIPRVTMAEPQLLAPQAYDANGVVYDSVASLSLSRPLYLRILNIDLILLIVVSAIYGVFFRPFDQIIPTIGGLVLGVWGVRSLLVGSYPPDSTGVDLVLETAIFLVLLIVGVRAIVYQWHRAHLPGSRPQGGSGGRDEADEEGLLELESEAAQESGPPAHGHHVPPHPG